MLGLNLDNEVHIRRRTRVAVERACHRADYHVRNRQFIQRFNHLRENVEKALHRIARAAQ